MHSLISLLVAVSCVFKGVIGAPVAGDVKVLSTRQNATAQAAPHWVVYSDKFISGADGPPDPSVIAGYNVFILSFILTSGATDQALEWQQLSATSRSSIKAAYEKAGIKLMVSAFGATETPTTNGSDPVALANTMAKWVVTYGLDGIDVDYEDFSAMGNGTAEAWLVTFTKTLRTALPSPQYIITHAPVAPWFSSTIDPGGAYVTVNNQVGNLIDWYNVQFYNQGSTEYTNCSGLLTESSARFPNTALFQINSVVGVPLSQLVIGKPANTTDAVHGQGFMDANTLATCVGQAKNMGWSAGVMTWQFPDAANGWITTVRSTSFPI